jgi:hypothetical protein
MSRGENRELTALGIPTGGAGEIQFFPNSDLVLGTRSFWKYNAPSRSADLSQESDLAESPGIGNIAQHPHGRKQSPWVVAGLLQSSRERPCGHPALR